MKLNRSEFLAALEKVKPAIGKSEDVQQFMHVWFSGKDISANDDSTGLGIVVPFATEFKGGLRGHVLLGHLNATTVEDVELVEDDPETFKIVMGRSRLKLALLPLEQQLWTPPKAKAIEELEVTEQLLQAIKRVGISAGSSMAMPEQLGITLIPNKQGVQLYTTDAATVAHASVETDQPFISERSLISHAFFEQIIKQVGVGGKLLFSKDGVVAVGDGIKVYSRLMRSDKPLDFAGMEKRHTSRDDASFGIPGHMANVMERALNVLKSPGAHMTLSIEGDVLKLSLDDKFAYGELHETITLKGGELSDISVKADPALLRRGLDVCDHMRIGPAAVVMTAGDDFSYFVSVH